MKRTATLQRRAPLAADPDKVQEWLRRSRERARAQRQAPDSAAAPPVGARDATEPPTLAWALRAPFRPAERPSAHRCFRCNRQAHHWHHWLPQRDLRVYMRGVAQRDRVGPSEVRRRLLELLRDRRNLSAVCSDCHDEHEHPGVGSQRFAWGDVPESAREFAAELGPEWEARLLRAYGMR